jgi:polyphosphate kinase 2 (PPK2 family)
MLDLQDYLSEKCGFDLKKILVRPSQAVSLARDFDPDYIGELKDKADAEGLLQQNIALLTEQQDILYANASQSLLLIFQAVDAAGKDSTIKHVMSGVNPQGCEVSSFKSPSEEELRHDYLWRTSNRLPEHGRIGIFNRFLLRRSTGHQSSSGTSSAPTSDPQRSRTSPLETALR